MSCFQSFRYVQAFYSFYFVIEGLFAGGKTGEKAVLKEFSKSMEFSQIAKDQLESIFKEPRHRASLKKLFAEEGCSTDAPGLQQFLYKIRGNLHHYARRSPKTRGTPFNQKEYESIALLTMLIATAVIANRFIAINQG